MAKLPNYNEQGGEGRDGSVSTGWQSTVTGSEQDPLVQNAKVKPVAGGRNAPAGAQPPSVDPLAFAPPAAAMNSQGVAAPAPAPAQDGASWLGGPQAVNSMAPQPPFIPPAQTPGTPPPPPAMPPGSAPQPVPQAPPPAPAQDPVTGIQALQAAQPGFNPGAQLSQNAGGTRFQNAHVAAPGTMAELLARQNAAAAAQGADNTFANSGVAEAAQQAMFTTKADGGNAFGDYVAGLTPDQRQRLGVQESALNPQLRAQYGLQQLPGQPAAAQAPQPWRPTGPSNWQSSINSGVADRNNQALRSTGLFGNQPLAGTQSGAAPRDANEIGFLNSYSGAADQIRQLGYTMNNQGDIIDNGEVVGNAGDPAFNMANLQPSRQSGRIAPNPEDRTQLGLGAPQPVGSLESAQAFDGPMANAKMPVGPSGEGRDGSFSTGFQGTLTGSANDPLAQAAALKARGTASHAGGRNAPQGGPGSAPQPVAQGQMSEGITAAPGLRPNAQATDPDNPLTNQTLSVGNTADRFRLAQDQFANFQRATDPQYRATLRDTLRAGAAAGGLGSGQLRTSLGDAGNNRELQLDTQRNDLLNNALTGSIDDAYRNVGIAQQQQGFQQGQQQQAFGNEMSRLGMNENLTGGSFNRELQRLLAGERGNPADIQMALSGIFGNQASAAGQSLADMIRNSSSAPSGGAPSGGGNNLQSLLDLLGGNRPPTAPGVPGVQGGPAASGPLQSLPPIPPRQGTVTSTGPVRSPRLPGQPGYIPPRVPQVGGF